MTGVSDGVGIVVFTAVVGRGDAVGDNGINIGVGNEEEVGNPVIACCLSVGLTAATGFFSPDGDRKNRSLINA
jgi:hypothetical protein